MGRVPSNIKTAITSTMANITFSLGNDRTRVCEENGIRPMCVAAVHKRTPSRHSPECALRNSERTARTSTVGHGVLCLRRGFPRPLDVRRPRGIERGMMTDAIRNVGLRQMLSARRREMQDDADNLRRIDRAMFLLDEGEYRILCRMPGRNLGATTAGAPLRGTLPGVRMEP